MITFDDTYLNKTPHKSPRPAKPTIVLWHETAGSAESSLNWLMNPKNGGISWDILIARDGTPYRCLDSKLWYGGHAGEGTVSNAASIGVEVEGSNDGTPITAAQRATIIALMLYFESDYGIPLASDRHLAHKDTATPKGRKTDPRGYDVTEVLKAAQQAATTPMQVLKTLPAGTRYRTKATMVNVRRVPTLDPASVLDQLPQRGMGFYADKVVSGAVHEGSAEWVHAPDLGYIHMSLVEPETAGSAGDSPERTVRLEEVSKIALDLQTTGRRIIDLSTAMGLGLDLLKRGGG